jgi:ATP-binding cassette subfamily B protein
MPVAPARGSLIRHYLFKYRKWVGIGLLALVVVDALEILPPLFLKGAVDVVVERRPRERLLHFALAYGAVSLIQGVCRYLWRMYLIRASMKSGRDIRQSYARHLFGLPASFYDRRRIGDLMSLATNDVEAIRMAMGPGLLTFADALFYLATVPIAMFILSPQLTLLAFIPLPLIPWFVMRNEREVHARFEKVQESFGRLAAMAQENLNGIRVVKAFAREDAQTRRFREAGREYIRLNMHLAKVQSAFGPTLDFTMSLGLVLLLFVGGRYVQADAVTLGTFVAFQRYIQKMVWPMTAIGMAITYYQRSVASTGRLEEVLAERSDTPEPATPQLPPGYQPGGAWKTAGRVEFRDLTFAFPGAAKPALTGINLAIGAGERVAFVGTIGSGKSALLCIVPRLYPVADGMALVDGIDVNRWPLEELRRQVGYVGQEVFLFSETVTENVAFGLEAARTEGIIDHSTTLAAVHEEILGLPKSYETMLGERGVNLSGGQKQRLTIARAVAKLPSVLILDDALSSVDVHTEERILKALRSRAGRNTELIAAHRISTVRHADRIAVLEEGRIAQLGTHAELIRQRTGAYWRFHEQQRLKEDLEQYIDRLEL